MSALQSVVPESSWSERSRAPTNQPPGQTDGYLSATFSQMMSPKLVAGKLSTVSGS